jgi:cytochrome c biogenesis protein CcmG/thiol:disulfide interchange protein DsbE
MMIAALSRPAEKLRDQEVLTQVEAFSLPDLWQINQRINIPAVTGPILVNVFASWCGSCRIEHPFWMENADKIPVAFVGIGWNDSAENLKKSLLKNGNPYKIVGVDEKGNQAVSLGVTGVPETFLIAADGRVLAHHAGPMHKAVWDAHFLPQLKDFVKP